MQAFTRFFLARYETESFERRRQASILLAVILLLLFFSLVYSAAALLLLGNPAMAIITLASGLISLLSAQLLRQGRFAWASALIGYLFWAAITGLAVLPIVTAGRPVPILTRNTLLVFFFLVLFGERIARLSVIFLVNLAMLVLLHHPSASAILPGFVPADAGQLFNEIIILVLAFVLAVVKLRITERGFRDARRQAEENRRRYERVEGLFESFAARSNLGDTLIRLSERLVRFSDGIRAQLASIGTGIASLRERLAEVERATGDMNGLTGSVRESIVTQNTAVTQQSASVEEMTQTVRGIAETSRRKRDAVETLLRSAKEGIGMMLDSTRMIEEANREASGIISVLDVIGEISQRTNILAMNAAIEAAHAGEAGRGFSVVAEEIRKLAEQSAENAKVIGDTLARSIEKTRAASEASGLAGKGMEDISGGVDGIASTFSEIVGATDEVSAGTGEMLSIVRHLADLSGEVQQSVSRMEQAIIRNDESLKGMSSVFSAIDGKIGSDIRTLLDDFDGIREEMRLLEELGQRNKTDIESAYRELRGLKEQEQPAV